MRKIKHILDREEKLQGEYNALISCGHKATVSHWRKIVDVMDTVGGTTNILSLKLVTPNHLLIIGYGLPEKEWSRWVERCEKDKLTVVDLRSALMRKASEQATKQAESKAPTGQYSTIVVDPRLSLTPGQIGSFPT